MTIATCVDLLIFVDFYYKFTESFVQCIQVSNDWIYNNLLTKDTSSKEQWIDRCSMDIILRFYASVLSSTAIALVLVSVNEKDFHLVYIEDSHYHGVLGYMFLSNIYELLYLFTAYLFTSKNILSPFVNYISSMTASHQFVHLTVFATVLVILLS